MESNHKSIAIIATTTLAVVALLLIIFGPNDGFVFTFSIFYFCIFIVAAPLLIIHEVWSRWRRSRPQASSGSAGSEDTIEPNMGGLGLALFAAALAALAVFLPRLESDTFPRIAENTLIQGGAGWIILGCAVGIAGTAYRIYSQRIKTWSVFILGLVILGFAVYDGTGSRLELESASPNFYAGSLTDTASPAVGIYAAGAAGLMAMMAGWILAGHAVSTFDTGSSRKTKRCPDCAETVLSAARVCKHCGHQFQSPAV